MTSNSTSEKLNLSIARFVDYFINTRHFKDHNVLWRARIFVRACFLTSLFSTTYVFLSIVFDFYIGIYLMIFNVIGFLILPFLSKTRIPILFLGNLYVFIGASAVIVLTYFSGGVWSAIYPWIISIPILAILVVNRVAGLVWGAISFLAMVWFAILAHNGIELPRSYNTELHTQWYITIVPGLLLMLLFIAVVFEGILTRALENVEAQNQLLASQNETIETQYQELLELIDQKSYVIRILSHDLRSPLHNIESLLNLLKVDEENEEYKKLIRQSTISARDLVNRVLEMDISDQRELEIQPLPVDVCSILHKVVASMNDHISKKKISIHMDNMPVKCVVLADSTYLKLIFENLISNAIKFSRPDKNITIDLTESNDRVRVKVIDEGPGINPKEEDKLFKRFSKLSSRPTAGESSTGLGLSLAKRYVDLINGKLWYEGKYGVGSVFVVELPLANEKAAESTDYQSED